MKFLLTISILFSFNLMASDKKDFFNWGYFQEDVQKSILVRKVTYNKRYNFLLEKEANKTIGAKELKELNNLKIFFKKNPNLLMDIK